MGYCEVGRYGGLGLCDAETGLPDSICEKKATHTLVVKPVEKVCEGTGKGLYHICTYHAECLKISGYHNSLEDGIETTCPACGIKHENATIRQRIRKGIY